MDTAEWARPSEEDKEGQEHFKKARVREYKNFYGELYFEERSRERPWRDPIDNRKLAIVWWPKMVDAVQRYVRSYQICQARKVERMPPKGEMKSFVTHQSSQLVACDTLEPLPLSVSGAIHVLVAIDCFTRYVIDAAFDVEAETFANFLSNFVGRFGAPQEICTDNAPMNTSQEVRNVLEPFHIKHRRSTPHHHRGNAMVERAIQTLQEKLSLLPHDPATSADWQRALPMAY